MIGSRPPYIRSEEPTSPTVAPHGGSTAERELCQTSTVCRKGTGGQMTHWGWGQGSLKGAHEAQLVGLS